MSYKIRMKKGDYARYAQWLGMWGMNKAICEWIMDGEITGVIWC